MTNTFYFTMECPKCDEDIYYGPVVSLLDHNGLMAVPFDFMDQTKVVCPECDAALYFGELDYLCEDEL